MAIAWVLGLAAACGEGERRPAREVEGGEGVSVQRSPPGVDGIAGEAGVVDVAIAGPGACALDGEGRVRCWGVNEHGELGQRTRQDASPEPLEVPIPGHVGRLHRLGDGPGRGAYCASSGSGQVWCWGASEAQVGRDESPEAGPVLMPALEGAVQIDGQAGSACARFDDGEVRCWGVGDEGQLGDGGARWRPRPVQVRGLVGAVDLSMGRGHACAVDGSGAVWCWGRNREGQVRPDDTRPRRAGASRLPGLPPAASVAAGEGLSCALAREGGVWCWGRGGGRAPVEMAVRGARALVARDRVCALGGSETRCWTSLAEEGSPVPLADSEVLAIGPDHACGLLEGRMRCEGENRRGQLGDGTFTDRGGAEPDSADVSKTKPSPEPAARGRPPIGCRSAALELRHPQFWDLGAFPVVDARAAEVSGAMQIWLADHELPPGLVDAPRGEEHRLQIELRPGARTSWPGPYEAAGGGPGFEISLVDAGHHRAVVGSDASGASIGTLTVRHDDGAWICGEIDVHVRLLTLRGPFAARKWPAPGAEARDGVR